MQAAQTPARPERFDELGKLCWLWMNSPLQLEWNLDAATRFLLPPVELRQFHLIERDGLPVAYCSWAWLTAQAECAYMLNPAVIKLEDWQGGDRLWFVDWVAPFSARDSWDLRSAMKERFPQEVARAIRVRRDGAKARVMEFRGAALEPEIARARLQTYYTEFMDVAKASAGAMGREVVMNDGARSVEGRASPLN